MNYNDCKILSWNVFGFANRSSKQHMKEILRTYRPDIVFVLEPRTQFTTSAAYWNRMGYDRIAVEEARGFSGGIWVLATRGRPFTIVVREQMHQCITIDITDGVQSWCCSGVYASPQFAARCNLWTYLLGLRPTIQAPWMLIGDFNEILLPSEQKGGTFNSMRAARFSNVLQANSLIDLEYYGSKFTWQSVCRNNRLVSKRLDRAVGDFEWRMRFPEATVEHLVKRDSDHNPLLLRCCETGGPGVARPFRFLAAWSTHEAYADVVRGAWSRGRPDTLHSLHCVAQDSTVFNKEVFGNIFTRKRRLEARLRGIQRTLENIDSASLVIRQKELFKEYESILFQEETLWYQKSRENWIKLGSRNTRFFHTQTIVRRKRNKIHGLHISDGSWCTDQQVLQVEAINFFQDLFCSVDNVSSSRHGTIRSPLGEELAGSLLAPVTKAEVHLALMSMKSYKAPGPDGFQPIFFKMYWESIGDDVWSFVRQAFATGSFDPKAAETLLVLIPKGDRPSTFREFRPITLCNVIHKLISKVLVNRLRPHLDTIVSPLQSSFIPGRGTRENAIILQEFVHHMGKKRSKKGDMILKLDLEKAYDRVDWLFLKETLVMFGFPVRIVNLIMHGITQSRIALLWNGSKTDNFSPKRGLRQGDPLSPYLFVLCMERFGEMISTAVNERRWQPLHLTKHSPGISHLFFADDVLLFAKATATQAREIKCVLDGFASISGLKVSLQKSSIFASKGVPRTTKQDIKGLLDIKFTNDLGKYLGFKVFQGRIKKEDFHGVLDRIHSKLASWKGQLLNKAGRLTLSNSVLASIPSYGMQLQWFPQSVCLQVDRAVRNFIWQGNTDSGMHMVGWQKITKPKRHGGLGVRVTRHHNTALLGKLIWEATASPEKLWVRLMKDKYFRHHSFLGARKTTGSSTWNSMLKARDCLGPGFAFKFGNGESSFWNDSWLFASPLGPLLPCVEFHDLHLKLKDVYVGGNWQLDILYTTIPQEWRDPIVSLQPTLVPNVRDAWIWSGNFSGVYTVNSAYQMLLDINTDDTNSSNWAWLWKLKIPANVQFFLWQFCHKSLPTKATLLRRNVLDSATCTICSNMPETAHHCLFECKYAKEVWSICCGNHFTAPESDFTPLTWLREAVGDNGPFVVIIMWRIWCARNRLVFEAKDFRSQEVAAQAHGLWHDVQAAYGSMTSPPRHSSGLTVAWQAPPAGWVALNVDGSAQPHPPLASFGGLIRDNTGRFLRGFYGSLGSSSIIHAELHAILYGLEMCWTMGFKQIVCYSDSSNALQLIDNALVVYHLLGNEVALIRDLLARAWDVKLQHVFREANFCADYLAKCGISGPPRVTVEAPPAGLISLLQADAQGCSFIRP